MSEQKPTDAQAENTTGAAELSNEELDQVVGGLARPVPAVRAAAAGQPTCPSDPSSPGQQQGIIAVLIG